MRPLPLALLIALAASATAADRPSRVPDAAPAGPPVSCVGLPQIRETRVRDDRTIDFVMRDGRVYRNVLPANCPELGFEQRYSYETSLSELCSTDIIHVLHATGPFQGASCGLGQFQPVTLAAQGRGAKR
ncbi:hypothetical protein [uncultured Sphingomonas sp.]|uniref:hypothetical protein n=1 Tax=uncultured Sphingomonas sp. TaxID=158754 RepID=UPI0035CC0B7D